jgi:hypothetical protein
MPSRISASDEQALLLADILHGVPDKLSRVQSALKPVAQGKHSVMSVDERLVVAQACTTLQFAIADILCVVTFVTEALKTDASKEFVDLARQQRAATQNKRSDAH